MLELILEALRRTFRRSKSPARRSTATTTTCSRKKHFGERVYVTRKGAISAAPRASSASSRAAWARAPTIVRARATPNRSSPAPTGRGAA